MTNLDQASVWHNDKHSISLELNRASVIISEIHCPETEDCHHQTYGCMVTWFLNRFGLDCNVGVAPAAANIEIAWMLAGDPYDLEAAQIWVIPTTDDAFAAWLITQQ